MNTEQLQGWEEPTTQMQGSITNPHEPKSEDVGMGQQKARTTEPQAR